MGINPLVPVNQEINGVYLTFEKSKIKSDLNGVNF